jgi:uncharacterized membrane protein YgdD (TMEM256/DUF423 family)
MTGTSAASRLMIAAGALAGLATVAMAAVNAHAVHDPDARELIATAVQMQGWHAIILVVCGVWAERGGRLAQVAGAAFAAGLLIFCGDVYLLAFGGPHLGVAPVGGVILMLGWLLLAASALFA